MEDSLLTPVFSLEESGDEAVEYLKAVRVQAQQLNQVPLEHPEAFAESKYLLESSIPRYSLDISESTVETICQEFSYIRNYIEHWKTPQEASERYFGTKQEWYEYMTANKPFLEYLVKFDQVTVNQLLSWCSEFQDFLNLSEWIYALLGCLELPLLPETACTLNFILVQAVKALPFSQAALIIVLVTNFFGQRVV